MIRKHLLQTSTSLAVSSLITVSTSIILVRYFGPEAFGLQATVVSIATILSTICLWSYHTLAVVESDNTTYDSLLVHCYWRLFWSMLLLTFAFFIIQIFSRYITLGIGNSTYCLIICLTFLLSFNTIQKSELTHRRLFGNLAIGNLAGTISQSIFQLLSGFFFPKSYMLLFGTILGKIMTVIFFWRNSQARLNLYRIRLTSRGRSFRIASFQLTLPSLLNIVSVSSIVPIIAFFTDLNFAGQYSLAFLMLSIPAALLGQSISTILFGHLPSMQESPERKTSLLKNLYIFVTFVSLVIFVPVFAFLRFGALDFIPSNWELLPQIMLALTPWMCANLVSSSLSAIATTERQFDFVLRISLIEFATRLTTLISFFLFSTSLGAVSAYSFIGNLISVYWIWWMEKKFKFSNLISRCLIVSQIVFSIIFWTFILL